MPPRLIAIAQQTWNYSDLAKVLIVTEADRAEGLILDVSEGVLNSVAIGAMTGLIRKCKGNGIPVEVVVHDDTTFKSLERIGLTKLVPLRLHKPDAVRGSTRHFA